jgi:hypothetical protein
MLYNFRLWLENTFKKKEEEKNMSSKITIPTFSFKSDSAVNSPLVYEIKRIGKNLVVENTHGEILPVSREIIQNIGNVILEKNQSAKIIATGVSRAEVGLIVGDLKRSSTANVYAIKILPKCSASTGRIYYNRRNSLNKFEILLQKRDKK